MNMHQGNMTPTGIEKVESLSDGDLVDLCRATVGAISDGNGFGWLDVPPRKTLESYWKGVMLVPNRELYIARLDGHIVGSGQLLKPYPNNEAGAHAAQVEVFFIAPHARGHGLARGLIKEIELSAAAQGFEILDFNIRATQKAAIGLAEAGGFRRWGTKLKYAKVGDEYVDGYYYCKDLV